METFEVNVRRDVSSSVFFGAQLKLQVHLLKVLKVLRLHVLGVHDYDKLSGLAQVSGTAITIMLLSAMYCDESACVTGIL